MKKISTPEIERICTTGKVLARDNGFIRAVRTSDGKIWKFFRAKPLPSSAALRPYASRFVHSSRKLHARGIASVQVRDQYTIAGQKRHVVVYDELPGMILRDAISAAGDDMEQLNKLFTGFAQFIARLHRLGVYFRSMHFGNVLVLAKPLPTGQPAFGLIDITETQFALRSLSPWRRARNFRPITSYEIDRNSLDRFGNERFLEEYLRATSLSTRKRQSFLQHLQRLNKHLAPAASSLLAKPYNQSQ